MGKDVHLTGIVRDCLTTDSNYLARRLADVIVSAVRCLLAYLTPCAKQLLGAANNRLLETGRVGAE